MQAVHICITARFCHKWRLTFFYQAQGAYALGISSSNLFQAENHKIKFASYLLRKIRNRHTSQMFSTPTCYQGRLHWNAPKKQNFFVQIFEANVNKTDIPCWVARNVSIYLVLTTYTFTTTFSNKNILSPCL